MQPDKIKRKIELKSANSTSLRLVETPGRSRFNSCFLICTGLFPILIATGVLKGGFPQAPPLITASIGLPFVLAGLIFLSRGQTPLSARTKILMFLFLCSTALPLGWFALFSTAPIEFRCACGLPFLLLLMLILWRYQNREEEEWQRTKVLAPIKAQASSQIGHESLLARFRRDEKSNKWFGASAENGVQMFVFAAVCTLITSLVLFTWGLCKIGSWHEMTAWPTIRANVTRTYVERCRASGPARFKPRLTYSYAVEKQTYNADDVICGDLADPAEAAKLLTKYGEGSKIDIRYNPKRPEKSIWNLQEFCTQALGLIAVALVTFFVSAFCALSAWLSQPKEIHESNDDQSNSNQILDSDQNITRQL